MGWAYSLDLRERVVGAFDAGDMTDDQVADLFQVGEATVHRWKRLKRETGSLVPPPPRGGGMPPRVAPEKYDLVREIVREQPDLTIPEVAHQSPADRCAVHRPDAPPEVCVPGATSSRVRVRASRAGPAWARGDVRQLTKAQATGAVAPVKGSSG
jgi:hypothetical protein